MKEIKKHFLEALRLLNMHPEDIDRIRKCDFREAQVFSIGEPPLRIDFLTKVNLVSFEEALSHQKFFYNRRLLCCSHWL